MQELNFNRLNFGLEFGKSTGQRTSCPRKNTRAKRDKLREIELKRESLALTKRLKEVYE